MKTIENTSNGYKNLLTVPELSEFLKELEDQTKAEKALKFLIAHWRYHVVNATNRSNAEKVKAMLEAKKAGKAYEGKGTVEVKTDFLQWLAEAPREREIAEDPMATRLWSKLSDKLGFDLTEADPTERGVDWTSDVEIINTWVETVNMAMADDSQLPTLEEAFDKDGEPNEHPVTFERLQRALRSSRKK
jgi:hypothetical protein